MGASGWAYFVPYQVDTNRALQELRKSVFQSGEYYSEAKLLSTTLESMRERVQAEMLQQFQNRLSQLQNQPKPQTIEELLEMNGESGTHSILDIDGISKTTSFGKIAPLSPQQLRRLFGSEEPTREKVEKTIVEIQSLCRRWEGVFLCVFQNGLPSEICFVGVSGD